MKNNINIMEVIFSFQIGGSEMLAVKIANFLRMSGYNISVCATHSVKGPISDILENNNIRCFAMDVNSYNWFVRRVRLFFLFKSHNIHTLHIQHVSMFMLCYYPAKLAGVKNIIVTEHNNVNFIENKKLTVKARRYLSKVSMVTVIHDQLRNYFIEELGVKKNKITTIYNGVDIEKYTPGHKDVEFLRMHKIAQSDIILGIVGRLHPYKNHLLLFKALANICRKFTHIKLLVIGDGQLKNALVEYSYLNNLDNNIIFLGEQNNISFLLNNLDIMVFASTTEGVPMALLEGMSSGLPCISTNVGGVSDVIINDNNGLLIQSGSVDELELAITRLAKSEEDRARLGKMARRTICDKFNEKYMLNNYLNVINNAPMISQTP